MSACGSISTKRVSAARQLLRDLVGEAAASVVLPVPGAPFKSMSPCSGACFEGQLLPDRQREQGLREQALADGVVRS